MVADGKKEVTMDKRSSYMDGFVEILFCSVCKKGMT